MELMSCQYVVMEGTKPDLWRNRTVMWVTVQGLITVWVVPRKD